MLLNINRAEWTDVVIKIKSNSDVTRKIPKYGALPFTWHEYCIPLISHRMSQSKRDGDTPKQKENPLGREGFL
jgi:hypothetical protein